MALIRCGECGRQVSDQAYVCPNCGRDVRSIKASGGSCNNCTHDGFDEGGDCGCYGPSGYPCLMYDRETFYDDLD